MFLDRVEATPEREAFRGKDAAGQWQSLTWRQARELVEATAAGLFEVGVQRGDSVAVIGATSVEWVLVDTAVLCAGAATTAVYPSTVADDVAYILGDARCRVVLADQDQVAKLREQRASLPHVELVVALQEGADHGDDGWVVGLDELRARGRARLEREPSAVTDVVDTLGPEDLATLIYTSGTTGRPKGVRLVHDNWTYEAVAIEALGLFDVDDLQYLWLPLSHVFGKICTCAHFRIGFVTAVNGDVTTLVDDLATVRPTFMAAAPRIFEKVHNRVVGQVTQAGGAKEKLFRWALATGREVSQRRQQGRAPGPLLAAQHAVADRLVLSKVRGRFGGRMKYFVSGSAALSQDVAEFFHAMGVLILEGYGLTETSAAIFANRPGAFRFGTVGRPLPGMEMRLGEDGELQVRGPAVMRGYHHREEETAQVLDADGWLRTGDIAELDPDGFLRITDRKKDLIKTSNGKYVAPQAVEIRLKALCPYLSQVVVHGDGRTFCSALLTLDADEIRGWAKANGKDGASYEELTRDPQVQAMLSAAVDQLNASVARHEQVRRFAVLPRDLDVEHGELTPSMKVKRRFVEREFRPTLDAFYQDA
ncbi:AMP-dependent synthetase/ligase [Vallicoccus soli]|uniref:Long-chain fatty acid--CoA ligase n=1 Tax=Vallicoccus soli TaxID=2339232 RepID=A0A3A3Z6A3_9ACTN|nr:long-chain fatty acid--CoA ligase [Vallicoccus soli]